MEELNDKTIEVKKMACFLWNINSSIENKITMEQIINELTLKFKMFVVVFMDIFIAK